ncbi:MAG: kinase/pyrophosphorylase, partial [Propionivibrio sp.]
AEYSGAQVKASKGSAHLFDEDYYRRVEAMKFTLAHDDGLATDDLEEAEVIVVGVSRATKTPTCMYLASRGIKAANVPLVPGVRPAAGLMQAKGPLIVGLTIDPARLAVVRRDRLQAWEGETISGYADGDSLRQEIREARRLFVRCGWPVIDTSKRSIEQTASMIIDLLRKRAGEGKAKE